MTDPTLIKQIALLEHRLHDPEIRRSPQELGKLLTDDFLEFGASGEVYNKQEIVDLLLSDPGLELEVENEVVNVLAPGVCLITYTSVKKIDTEIYRTNRSSIWKFDNESWKMVFHQGTRIENMET